MNNKTMNARQFEAWYRDYTQSNDKTVWDVYNKPSQAKVKAWFNCLSIVEENDGKNYKIINHNINQFTFGFISKFSMDGKEDDIFHVITKDNHYVTPFNAG